MAPPKKLKKALEEIKVEAIFPESASFLTATARNKRLTVYPEVVVVPKDADEVSKVIKVAKQFQRRVVPLSGGHSAIANGVGGTDGALVIDLKKLNGVKYDSSTKRITFGPGNRLGDVVAALKKEKRAIPHGTCMSVGLGGHSAFGGFGFASRLWGLNCHAIYSMDLVTDDGTTKTVSKDSTDKDKDLFWAMRGAGPSFGIATSITYKTESAPRATNFKFVQTFLYEKAASVMVQFQNDAAIKDKVPKEVGLQFRVDKGSDTSRVQLSVSGTYYGKKADAKKFVKYVEGLMELSDSNASETALFSRHYISTNPATFFAQKYSGAEADIDYFDSILNIAADPTITGDSIEYAKAQDDAFNGIIPSIPDLNVTLGSHLSAADELEATFAGSALAKTETKKKQKYAPPDPVISFYMKTLMVPDLSSDALKAFMKYTAENGFNSNLTWFVAFKLLGGVDSQLKSYDSDASFAWSNAMWFVELNADARVRDYPKEGYTLLDNMVKAITNNISGGKKYGAYPGFCDDRLSDYQKLYYADNYAKLKEIRGTSATGGLFVFPQSI